MIRGLAAHAALEFRTGVRDKTLLLMTYLFPLGFFGFMGVFMTEMNPVFAEVMIPGMTVFAMLAASLFGLPGPLISAREAGILRSYRIYGVPTGAVFGVPAATTAAHLMIVAGLIAGSAPFLFEATPVRNGALFALVAVIGSATHVGLGALIGVVSADARISVLGSQLLFLPSVLLAGLIVPFDQIPELFQPFSLLLPATYAMEAFGGLAFGTETLVDPWLALGTLAAGAVLAFMLTRLVYSWDTHGSGRKLPTAAAVLALAPYAAVAAVIAR
ncbi:MAG TPA: ABC transporter permease [Acidimicrobiia bacterium]|nr:ABC transporter permease [Acidimicrobiia bacterium]